MKKIRLGVLALITAAALLLPAFPASAEGLEVTAPSAVLMEASTGQAGSCITATAQRDGLELIA